MSTSDLIGIISSTISLIATIVIAVMQIKQSNRMEEFEKRQDLRDEKRHKETIESVAVSFLIKHNATINLLPLCAIATMYNRTFPYSREMYRDFCCLTKETQNVVLEKSNLKLRVKAVDDIYGNCFAKFENIYKDKFGNEDSPFYDGGKYIYRCIEIYGNKEIPNTDFKYDNYIANVIAENFREDGKPIEDPILHLNDKYKFSEGIEINACQYATTLAKYISMYSDPKCAENEYVNLNENIDMLNLKMEDLFLETLFYMYTHIKITEVKTNVS